MKELFTTFLAAIIVINNIFLFPRNQQYLNKYSSQINKELSIADYPNLQFSNPKDVSQGRKIKPIADETNQVRSRQIKQTVDLNMTRLDSVRAKSTRSQIDYGATLRCVGNICLGSRFWHISGV